MRKSKTFGSKNKLSGRASKPEFCDPALSVIAVGVAAVGPSPVSLEPSLSSIRRYPLVRAALSVGSKDYRPEEFELAAPAALPEGREARFEAPELGVVELTRPEQGPRQWSQSFVQARPDYLGPPASHS